MRPSDEQKLEILKLEMGLLQSTLDKYDDLIFRSRNWFITLWIGAVGISLSIGSRDIALLAVFAAVLYWAIEGIMRHQYSYKYVDRYRTIRDWLHRPSDQTIQVYDLTNHHGARTKGLKLLRKTFFKLEPTLVYALMACAALVVRWKFIEDVRGGM